MRRKEDGMHRSPPGRPSLPLMYVLLMYVLRAARPGV
jgi:hypothetical protein